MENKDNTAKVYYPTAESKIRIEKILKRDFGSASRAYWTFANAWINKDFMKNLISLAEMKEREWERENNLNNGGRS